MYLKDHFRILFYTGDMDIVCPPLQVAFGARKIAEANGMNVRDYTMLKSCTRLIEKILLKKKLLLLFLHFPLASECAWIEDMIFANFVFFQTIETQAWTYLSDFGGARTSYVTNDSRVSIDVLTVRVSFAKKKKFRPYLKFLPFLERILGQILKFFKLFAGRKSHGANDPSGPSVSGNA